MSVTFDIRVCVCDTHQEKEAQNLMENLECLRWKQRKAR